jgi:hypothetical protein
MHLHLESDTDDHKLFIRELEEANKCYKSVDQKYIKDNKDRITHIFALLPILRNYYARAMLTMLTRKTLGWNR